MWDVEAIRAVVAVIAEPASVGLSAIAAAALPHDRNETGGVHVVLGPDAASGRTVRAPIAPGRFETLHVVEARRLTQDDAVRVEGPGVLSFDGERDLVLDDGGATLTIRSDGPWVIDVAAALAAR